MKVKESEKRIYWQDHRGVVQNMSLEEYERNTRSRTGFDERMGVVARVKTIELRTVQGDGRTGKSSDSPGENPGKPVSSENGEKEAEVDHSEPVQKVEKSVAETKELTRVVS